MNEIDPIGVRVMNFEEMVFRTEEHEPEHFSFATITALPGQQNAQQNQLLPEDPLRKTASILPIDAPIVLCNSMAQAMSASNQLTGFAAVDGAYLPQGTPATLDGTGAVYMACQAATRVSVITNRRKS